MTKRLYGVIVLRMAIIYPQIVPDTFKNEWIKDVSSGLYHSDKTAINSSSLKWMQESPHAFHYFWKKDQTKPRKKEVAKHFQLGHALHTALLEPKLFKQIYVVQPVFEGRTKEGKASKSASCDDVKDQKEAWLASLHPDAIVLDEKTQEALTEMINSVLAHQGACLLLKEGVPETTGYYRDPQTGIKCRIRPDFFNFNLNALIDVKSTKSISRKGFQREIMNYSYHAQLGMYWDGSLQINGAAPENCAFIAVENVEPYDCCVYEADPTVVEKGYQLYRKSMDQLGTCLSSGQWPRLQENMEAIHLPDWALKEEEEKVVIHEY